MAQRNWSTLGQAQRNRYIGWGRKQGWSAEQTREYYDAGGNLQRARGKSEGQEYAKRKESERRRSGKWFPLTPAQIKWLRSQGATDGDLRIAQNVPQGRVRKLIREQQTNVRRYQRDHTYKAGWTLQEKKSEGIPEVFFWYRGSSVWSNIGRGSYSGR